MKIYKCVQTHLHNNNSRLAMYACTKFTYVWLAMCIEIKATAPPQHFTTHSVSPSKFVVVFSTSIHIRVNIYAYPNITQPRCSPLVGRGI